MSWSQGALQAVQLGTTYAVAWDDRWSLIDCPEGTEQRLGARALSRIWLTGGRLDRLAGLLTVLERRRPAEVCFPLSDERGALLVEAWQRGWGGEVVLDAIQPGAAVYQDGTHVKTLGVRGSSPGIGLRFEHADGVVAFIPQGAPGAAARRLCHDADLVMLEAGAVDLDALALHSRTQVWMPTVGLA